MSHKLFLGLTCALESNPSTSGRNWLLSHKKTNQRGRSDFPRQSGPARAMSSMAASAMPTRPWGPKSRNRRAKLCVISTGASRSPAINVSRFLISSAVGFTGSLRVGEDHAVPDDAVLGDDILGAFPSFLLLSCRDTTTTSRGSTIPNLAPPS